MGPGRSRRRWAASLCLSALALASLAASGCGGDDEGSAPSSEEVQAALDEAVEAGAPGIALEIRGPEGDEFLISGYASIESGRPIRPDDLFRIASTTKSFTAAIVMLLVAEGELSLDDTAEDLAPGLLAAGNEDGRVLPEFVSAVLDCPTYFALYTDGELPASVLARFTARIDAPVVAGREHIVIAWPLEADGRKRHAGSAVLSGDGDALAVARALLIEPRSN